MLIIGFNKACNSIDSIYPRVGDESMGAIYFRTTEKKNLSHL